MKRYEYKLISVIIHDTMIKKIHETLIVTEEYIGQRLDQVLSKLLPDFSRTQIQDWITSGFVLVNQQQAKPKLRLKGSENISIDAEVLPAVQSKAEFIPLNIVYEDEALLIINKPAKMVVHPGTGNPDKTLLNALLFHCPELQELPRAGILHRLDKDTTGLLVIAKTPASLKSLSFQLKKRTLVREYQAIVYGKTISGGSIDERVGRHPLQRTKMAVVETGKRAITHYRVLKKFRAHTLLKVRLETGRTHQIRVHMMHIRRPIVGDVTYGGRVQLAKGAIPAMIEGLRQFKRQALHAFVIELEHPITHKIMRWEIDLPEDMQQLLKVLQEDTDAHST